jgi:branched-chain amino acid transport system substrate-binding protein
MRKMRLGSGLAVAGLLLLTACGGGSSEAPSSSGEASGTIGGSGAELQGDPVRLVFLTNSSGVFSALSEGSVQGVNAKVDEVNANGGVLGRPLEIDIIDTESDPTRATAVAEGIEPADDLLGVIGPEGTATCFAARSVLVEKQIPHYCSTGAPIPGGADGLIPGEFSPYYFAPASAPVVAGGEAPLAWMDDQGFETVAVISSSDASGQLYGGVFNKFAEGRIEVVANETFDAAAPDVTAQMTSIRAADPDVIYVGTTGGGLATVLQSVQDLGIDVPIWAGWGNASTTVAELISDLLPPGGLYTYGEAIHVYEELPEDNPQVERLREVNALWRDKFDEPLSVDAAIMWDIIANLVAAAETADTLEADAVVTALESGEEIAGLAGVYSITADDHRGTQPSNLIISFTEEGNFSLEDMLDGS